MATFYPVGMCKASFTLPNVPLPNVYSVKLWGFITDDVVAYSFLLLLVDHCLVFFIVVLH